MTALCCATPILAVVFGAVGVAAWLRWADYVLIPALLAFVGLTAYAAYRMRQERRQRAATTAEIDGPMIEQTRDAPGRRRRK